MNTVYKKKLYLDTSVISYLKQEDTPNEMNDTIEFWELLKMGVYEVYASEVTLFELSKCSEPKRTELLALLNDLEYYKIKVDGNQEIANLALNIEKEGLLPNKSLNDRLHIASAMISKCDILVSWNFKHIVNVKTIDGVRKISIKNHLNPIDIYSPTMLLERSD